MPHLKKKSISILLIDDDETDQYLASTYLKDDKRRKYTITTCKTLDCAKDHLLNEQFDAVLLDLQLPDSGGLDTLKDIIPLIELTPLIVLTGVDDDLIGEQAIKLGAEDYLPKKLANTFSLARAISYSIERHRLVSELKRKAQEDYLTGLPNRTMIYDKIDFMLTQSERSGQPFSLVMMDFDKFKQINDTKGHRFGDALIVAFARRLEKIMRKSDYVSRYGGDEFFMLVSNYANDDELTELLSKKQEALSEPYEVLIDNRSELVSMSVSIGVIKWKPGLSADQMLELADKAMYSSKGEKQGFITYLG